jgi:hypothetical protein
MSKRLKCHDSLHVVNPANAEASFNSECWSIQRLLRGKALDASFRWDDGCENTGCLGY